MSKRDTSEEHGLALLERDIRRSVKRIGMQVTSKAVNDVLAAIEAEQPAKCPTCGHAKPERLWRFPDEPQARCDACAMDQVSLFKPSDEWYPIPTLVFPVK